MKSSGLRLIFAYTVMKSSDRRPVSVFDFFLVNRVVTVHHSYDGCILGFAVGLGVPNCE